MSQVGRKPRGPQKPFKFFYIPNNQTFGKCRETGKSENMLFIKKSVSRGPRTTFKMFRCQTYIAFFFIEALIFDQSGSAASRFHVYQEDVTAT